jgi:hypothetical protein
MPFSSCTRLLSLLNLRNMPHKNILTTSNTGSNFARPRKSHHPVCYISQTCLQAVFDTSHVSPRSIVGF